MLYVNEVNKVVVGTATVRDIKVLGLVKASAKQGRLDINGK